MNRHFGLLDCSFARHSFALVDTAAFVDCFGCSPDFEPSGIAVVDIAGFDIDPGTVGFASRFRWQNLGESVFVRYYDSAHNHHLRNFGIVPMLMAAHFALRA